MRLKYLYIKNYKKFNELEIEFSDDKENYLKEKFFGNMNITLLVGENGAGKTTILSFIAYIFKNLERYQERIPSDFIIKYILDEESNNEIIIKKKDECVFINTDGTYKELLEFDYRKGRNKESRSSTKAISYDEIKKFLPSNVIISVFDSNYPKDYNWNSLGDRRLQIDKVSYNDSAFGMGISEGILKFLEAYFSDNEEFLGIMNNMGFKFSENLYIYRNFDSDSEKLKDLFDNFYKEFKFKNWKEFLKNTEFKSKKSFINHISNEEYWRRYCKEVMLEETTNSADLEFEYNEKINIKEFINAKFYNIKILSLLISNRLIFINEFFITKDGYDLSLEKMSTGEKILLCRLFFILANIQKNSLIIIEEPELHLNYSWVKQLISIITILYKNYNSHFFISTHNHAFINNLFQNNILIVEKEGINHPNRNTFLANERSINLELFKNSKIENSFEKKIIKIFEYASREEIEMIMDKLGESYLRFILFKKLGESGEN